MRLFNKIFNLLFILMVAGCAHTVSNQPNAGYQPPNHKKALTTDTDLLLSLLNRPMTEDQRMMLAFSTVSNTQTYPIVHYIAIKGEDSDTYSTVTPLYQTLIYQDSHAIPIRGTQLKQHDRL
jgi:hypothetical protein